jgi:hypothetical protein
VHRLLSILTIVFLQCSSTHERLHPENYISIFCERWEGEHLLEIEIVNRARCVDYGNVGILVTFYENGRNVGTEQLMYYGTLEKQSNVMFLGAIQPPRAPVHADSIGFTVTAQIANQ